MSLQNRAIIAEMDDLKMKYSKLESENFQLKALIQQVSDKQSSSFNVATSDELKSLTDNLAAAVSQQNILRTAQSVTTSDLSQIKVDSERIQDTVKNVQSELQQTKDEMEEKFSAPTHKSVSLVPIEAPFAHKVSISGGTKTLKQELDSQHIPKEARFVLADIFFKEPSNDNFSLSLGVIENSNDACMASGNSLDARCEKNLNKV